MVTRGTSPDIHASELDRWRRLQECLHTLNRPRWQQCLQPLAQHMVDRRLVRARGDSGAALRHLDLHVLREALSRLLRHEWDDAFLIIQLAIDGMDPALVAAERGVSRRMIAERLRDAFDQLAMEYEQVAYRESDQERVRGALARKRR